MSGEIVTTEGEPLPFERMQGEGEERFEAFSIYRDMGAETGGKRSLRQVAEQLGKSTELIERWSRLDGWQKRCFAFDAWTAAQRREALKAELQARSRQHAEALDAAITVLAEPAIQVARRIAKGELRVSEDVDPMYLLKLVESTGKVLPQLIQASRLVNGMSTENVALNGSLTHGAEQKGNDEIEAYLLGFDDGTHADVPEKG